MLSPYLMITAAVNLFFTELLIKFCLYIFVGGIPFSRCWKFRAYFIRLCQLFKREKQTVRRAKPCLAGLPGTRAVPRGGHSPAQRSGLLGGCPQCPAILSLSSLCRVGGGTAPGGGWQGVSSRSAAGPPGSAHRGDFSGAARCCSSATSSRPAPPRLRHLPRGSPGGARGRSCCRDPPRPGPPSPVGRGTRPAPTWAGCRAASRDSSRSLGTLPGARILAPGPPRLASRLASRRSPRGHRASRRSPSGSGGGSGSRPGAAHSAGERGRRCPWCRSGSAALPRPASGPPRPAPPPNFGPGRRWQGCDIMAAARPLPARPQAPPRGAAPARRSLWRLRPVTKRW